MDLQVSCLYSLNDLGICSDLCIRLRSYILYESTTPGRQVKQQLIHNQIKKDDKMTNIIDQFKVNGKVAIVTGGAMGLGKAMA